MTVIEIARKLAALGQTGEAVRAYVLAVQGELEPVEKLEAAAYILDNGGDYRVSYTCFQELYGQGFCQADILSLMTKAFYEPNIKLLQSRYERNCKRLARYPYLFRKDFIPFDQLPIRFFPYDDHNGYIPFYYAEKRFGDFVNIRDTVISRNFFADLEKPILATDVYSQYELEYLNDNVRRSEYVARDNHIYLHYTDWAVFCAWLQVLSIKPLVESEKVVFLIEEEIAQYPIDFKERFDIDYSQYSVKPINIGEISRMIWHTQLSTHNGGDFFNEIFDAHPNLLAMPSIMFFNIEEIIETVRKGFRSCSSLQEAMIRFKHWNKPWLVEELYHMREPSDKDFMVAMYLTEKGWSDSVDPAARIAPALFFQPHFANIVYQLRASQTGNTVLEAKNVEQIHESPLFKGFKYIKTFTPMRRFTTSHGATVKFMYKSACKRNEDDGKKGVVSDAISERVFNRSFMIDPEDRFYHDSVLVRFEDGKLNPKATFTALAAFLDLPYTESMTYCSEKGEHDPYIFDETLGIEKAAGFDLAPVYNTYDDYVNDAERSFIEYFLRDAYEFYGYNFQVYDGLPVDERRVAQWIRDFAPINHYMRETWKKVFADTKVSKNGERVAQETEQMVQEKMLDNQMKRFDQNRFENAKVLLEGLRFVNQNGQPLYMMPKLTLDPALLEQPLYH